MIKCQSRISMFCEKKIRKNKVKIIDGKEVCGYCYNRIKKLKEEKRNGIKICKYSGCNSIICKRNKSGYCLIHHKR